MKLNHDCVRDLLLYIEENCSYNNEISLNHLSLKNYTVEDIVYSADKLIEADYINCLRSPCLDDGMPTIIAVSITFSGHQFLDNIRDNKVWSETKSILSRVTSTSISFASSVAAQVLSNLISKNMRLS